MSFKLTQSPNNAPLFSKTIRKNAFQYQGPLLFNSLPAHIRNCESDMEGWKVVLDKFLEKIPDLPVTSLLDSGPCDSNAKPTNSLTHWYPKLRKEGVNLNESSKIVDVVNC